MTPDIDAMERLHNRLVELLGPGDAGTLVAVVTAVDTTSLVTKDDLTHELALVRAEMATMTHELIAAFRRELITAVSAQTKPLLFTVLSTAVVFAGALLTAVRLG
jgi:hypothetical protein